MTVRAPSVAENLAAVRARLAAAALAAGRPAAEVRLVAVSKTRPPEAIAAALSAGQLDFGENRIEEALPKRAALAASGARWHMIGHISRGARGIAADFALVSGRHAEAGRAPQPRRDGAGGACRCC
jgi:hypothetical protein